MKRAAIILYMSLFTSKIIAQANIVFQHLNTSNGLSYTVVNNMCVDDKGNLWIATANGLNMFNGKTTEKYFSSEYPQLKNSSIVQVECDGLNRIWVLTTGGNVTVLDENRKFHRVALYDTTRFVSTIRLLKTYNGTISLYTGKGNYTFSNSAIADIDSIPVTKIHPSLPWHMK